MGLLLASACQSPPPTFAPSELPTLPEPLLVFHGERVPSEDDPLVAELHDLRSRVQRDLKLPSSARPVNVYLHPDQQRFEQFVQAAFPELSDRRAIFVEFNGGLYVCAQWGEAMAEDLRHEVTHGYLHASLEGLPLWLDEGLAEYYESPPSAAGLHPRHVAMLHLGRSHGAWQPNLARLEELDRPGDMQQVDYAEAWAWTYWMLHGSDEARQVLHSYLEGLRSGSAEMPLSSRLVARLDGDPQVELLALLETLPLQPEELDDTVVEEVAAATALPYSIAKQR